VPEGLLVIMQTPPVQVAGAVHWLPSSTQLVAVRHCAQAPAPLQNPSPTDK
jgi:hypothetical protein